MDARAQLNVLLSETSAEEKMFHRAQELTLERAHIPIFPFFWTLMHVLDERSSLHGDDMARAIEASARVFVMVEVRDPIFATTVHAIHTYAAKYIRFGTAMPMP
jgi:inward rectifier potassium channel